MKIHCTKVWNKAALKKTQLVRFLKRGERLNSFLLQLHIDQEHAGSVMVTE
jgi:hypothetical protein